jgi:hypothetical protein
VRFIQHGICYCYALQFTTDREVASADYRALGVPFQGVQAGINLEGEAQTPPNPVVRFDSTTNPNPNP